MTHHLIQFPVLLTFTIFPHATISVVISEGTQWCAWFDKNLPFDCFVAGLCFIFSTRYVVRVLVRGMLTIWLLLFCVLPKQ